MVRMQLLCVCGYFLFWGSPAACFSKPPCVQFDVAQVVSAREVSSPSFDLANSADTLIRLEIPISSLVRLGREESLIQYLYVITGLVQPFEIVDYAPKTELMTDVSGTIAIEESAGRSATLGIQAYVPHDSPVKADANANVGSTSSNSVRFQQLPPRQLIAASGTMHRGRSAYFKLKPSTQTTLEGDKNFEIVARVPASWRAGILHVRCAAYAKPRGFSAVLDEGELVCGTRGFLVGAYRAGDADAKQLIWRLVQSQQRLRQLAESQADEIADRRYPTLGHKIGASLSLVKPRIPDGWLDQVLGSAELPELVKYLPPSVRAAAVEYHRARQAVLELDRQGALLGARGAPASAADSLPSPNAAAAWPTEAAG